MIVEERMRAFINSLDRGTPEWLDNLRRQASDTETDKKHTSDCTLKH